MKFTVNILLLSALFVSTAAHSADIQAKSRTYSHSCGYYSNQVSELEIVYKNHDLALGSKVDVIFGYEGYTSQPGNRPHIPFEWAQEKTQTVQMSAPNTWTFWHLADVHNRSSPNYVEAVDITFRLTHANGTVAYDNGSGTPWGFYRVILAPNGGCTSATMPLPNFEFSEIQTVKRH